MLLKQDSLTFDTTQITLVDEKPKNDVYINDILDLKIKHKLETESSAETTKETDFKSNGDQIEVFYDKNLL